MKKLTRSRPTWPSWGSAISITVRPMEMSKWPASSNRVQGGRPSSTGSSLVGVPHCSAVRPRKACSTRPSSVSRMRTVSSWAPICCSFRFRRWPPESYRFGGDRSATACRLSAARARQPVDPPQLLVGEGEAEDVEVGGDPFGGGRLGDHHHLVVDVPAHHHLG